MPNVVVTITSEPPDKPSGKILDAVPEEDLADEAENVNVAEFAAAANASNCDIDDDQEVGFAGFVAKTSVTSINSDGSRDNPVYEGDI